MKSLYRFLNILIRHDPTAYVSRALRRLNRRLLFEIVHWQAGRGCPWTGKKVSVFLSFDCDCEEDVCALRPLLKLLGEYGVKAAFAVVGSLAEKFPVEHAALLDGEHELMNHGWSEHASLNESNRAVSTFYFHQLSEDQRRYEIEHGHTSIVRSLGYEPVGFRTPHFGTFQRAAQLMSLYAVLLDLGYVYSSSVTAARSARGGTAFRDGSGIVEFPLTGCPQHPTLCFDSWHTLSNTGRQHAPSNFFALFQEILDFAVQSPFQTVVNFYFDPRDVATFDGFNQVVQYLVERQENIWLGTYREALPFLFSKADVE